jgi:4-hydroxy-tetrahydrodipicolinate reductase
MRLAVVGYGKMGHEVEAVARERGHEVVCIDLGQDFPAGCVVGIDFTQPDAVVMNVRRALQAGARCVVGTTGWGDKLGEVTRLVEEARGGLVHAANFSLGVNLYYRVVRQAAALMARFAEYDPYVLEKHHRQKKDAPSGTAKVLAQLIEASAGPRRRPIGEFAGAIPQDAFHVAAVRAGGIIGEHVVGFDSGTDEILIEHRARTRRGFATGAVIAAEWIASRTGVFAFDAVIDDLTRATS